MEYLTISQVAAEWKISNRRIQVLCSQNRIQGAYQFGRTWAIPADAQRMRGYDPVDIGKSGRKRKKRNDRERDQHNNWADCESNP